MNFFNYKFFRTNFRPRVLLPVRHLPYVCKIVKNKYPDILQKQKIPLLLFPQSRQTARVLSSVGSEHLVYTQRVGGSNPSGPTKSRRKSKQTPENKGFQEFFFFPTYRKYSKMKQQKQVKSVDFIPPREC